mgnify:CR=1 FL=1
MPEISFYHLTKTPLEKALPQLLEKAVASGKHIVLLSTSEDQLTTLDNTLWTYSTKKFLPHGREQDGFAEKQPIYLTTTEQNPNQAEILVLTDGAEPEYLPEFARILDVFDGNDEAAVTNARTRWKKHQDANHTLTYWQQDAKGAWQKAA